MQNTWTESYAYQTVGRESVLSVISGKEAPDDLRLELEYNLRGKRSALSAAEENISNSVRSGWIEKLLIINILLQSQH